MEKEIVLRRIKDNIDLVFFKYIYIKKYFLFMSKINELYILHLIASAFPNVKVENVEREGERGTFLL